MVWCLVCLPKKLKIGSETNGEVLNGCQVAFSLTIPCNWLSPPHQLFCDVGHKIFCDWEGGQSLWKQWCLWAYRASGQFEKNRFLCRFHIQKGTALRSSAAFVIMMKAAEACKSLCLLAFHGCTFCIVESKEDRFMDLSVSGQQKGLKQG